jgi:multiple sugar transport system ATP-binding protein
MVYVTHDQVEAMTMASRIVVLNRGVIEQVGSPLELYRNPHNRFVAGFLGAPRMNFFSVTVGEVSGATVSVSTSGLAPVSVQLTDGASVRKGDTLTLGVRPENIAISPVPAEAPIQGRVQLVEHLGRETILYANAGPLQCISSESGTGNITVQIGHATGVRAETAIGLRVDPEEIYLFSTEDERTITRRKPILNP